MEGSAFVYSAYVDDRSMPRDVNETIVPVVRVFVYFDRGTNTVKDWRCVLWYGRGASTSGRRLGVITRVHTATDINPEAYNYRSI